MNEAKKLALVFRAAARGATARMRPPEDWNDMRVWTSEVFSESETNHMHMMESVFSAIADVFEKVEESEA